MADLKKPVEWQVEFGLVIVDADGWRGKDGKSFDEPISREEFQKRMMISTVKRSRK